MCLALVLSLASFIMKLSSFALLSILFASTAAAQTAPKDTVEQKPAPVSYQVRNPRIIMSSEGQKPIDNANVTYAAQFGGAFALKPEPGQDFLANIQQLTFGGENLAPSFSPDGQRIVFEARSFSNVTCRQVFSITIDGKDPRRISTGKGEALWATFSPKGERVLYTSTHAMIDGACPPPTDLELKNPIAINALYDLYVADSNGQLITPVTDDKKVFDGLAAISPDNKKIVFSSTRAGDVDLFLLDLEKNEIRQLTSNEGFDGYARFSPDGKQIVFCSSRKMGKDVNIYRRNLFQGNVDLTDAELYVMDIDGTSLRQLTANGALNTQPIFSPNGESVVFASNMHDTSRTDMAIFAMKLADGGQPVMCLNSAASEEHPAFSPDGRKFVFVSNRGAKMRGERNIFVADWKH